MNYRCIFLGLVALTFASESEAKGWKMWVGTAASIRKAEQLCGLYVFEAEEGAIRRAMVEGAVTRQQVLDELAGRRYRNSEETAASKEAYCRASRNALNRALAWSSGASSVAGEKILPYDVRYWQDAGSILFNDE